MGLECPAQRGGLGRRKGSECLEGAMAQGLIGGRGQGIDQGLLDVSASWIAVCDSS